MKNLINKESGGDYNAKNPTSSASGKYQILDSTYADIAKNTGKSVQWLKTPEGQEFAMSEYLYPQYEKTLVSLNQEVNEENIYTVHQLGSGRATRYFNKTLTGKDYTIMWKNLPASIQKFTKKTEQSEILKQWNKIYRGGKSS